MDSMEKGQHYGLCPFCDTAAARYTCLVYVSPFLVLLPGDGHVFTAQSFVTPKQRLKLRSPVAFYCRRAQTHTLGRLRR